MKKYFLLAGSSLRKAKGQMIAIIVLILLASAMLNIWLMLAMDYRQNFDRCHDSLNAEHVSLLIDKAPGEISPCLERLLNSHSQITDYRIDTALGMTGSFAYYDGEMNTNFVIMEKDAALARSIGRVEMVEEGTAASGVYLPMLYKTEDIAVGNSVAITIGNLTMDYTVCGFFNSVMTGSHNCGMCALLLTKDKYRELEETGYVPQSSLVSVRISDSTESQDMEAMLNNAVSTEFPNVRSVSNSYTQVSQSRYISQMICSGIVSAAAFFILLVALVVIVSNIVNYIQENMKNLGALKACGYTGRQLTASLQLQFSGVSLAASLAGVLLSYGLFPAVNAMMISQTGIPYQIRFLPLPMLLTLLISEGAVILAVLFSSRKIRKTEAITALRQGIKTHSFRRNPIPLEGTAFPLSFALSLKTTFSGIRQNVTICVTMLVLSLFVVFSGLMTENMIRDMTPFLNLIVGETADSCISISLETEQEFLRKMNADDRVEKVYLYHSLEVRHVGGVGLMATICDDFSRVNNEKVCIEGRFPKYDNEVAIAAKYAAENKIQIGEQMTLTAGGKEAVYLVCGYTQISNNLGRDCLLTRAGFEKLGILESPVYYLNLADHVDIDDFNQEVSAWPELQVFLTLNIFSIVTGSASVYLTMMKVIVAAILALGLIIILLVLYLLVRTMLNNKKRDFGILKALGFTTKQLILQTALSFMPAVICSVILGIMGCSLVINPLTALFLNGIGIVKCTFTVPTGFNILAGAGIILFTFGVTCLLSLKIRKFAPRALLAGE